MSTGTLRRAGNQELLGALQRAVPSPAPSGSGGTAAPSVFYVNFQNVAPPGTPDHSRVDPGPPGGAANRAGFTRVRLRKRMTISWDTLPTAAGSVQLYARSVNVLYRLDPIEVAVSSSYAVGSCPYRVTLEHERAHVRAFTGIFHAARTPLVTRLNRVAVPTLGSPQPTPAADVSNTKDGIAAALAAQIRAHSRATVAEMERDRNRKDSAASYALVYARCPASRW